MLLESHSMKIDIKGLRSNEIGKLDTEWINQKIKISREFCSILHCNHFLGINDAYDRRL